MNPGHLPWVREHVLRLVILLIKPSSLVELNGLGLTAQRLSRSRVSRKRQANRRLITSYDTYDDAELISDALAKDTISMYACLPCTDGKHWFRHVTV